MKILCTTLSIALLGTSLVSGQMRPVHQFSVELKTTILMPAGTNELYSFTNQFSVELGRSWWRISNRDLQNGLPPEIGGNLPSHMEAVGDYRSRTYQIVRFENHEMPVAGTNSYGVPRTSGRTSAEVFPTPYPQETGYGLLALWYAFCSGVYLEQQDHAEVVAAWEGYLPKQPILMSNILYKAKVEWLGNSDGLPAEMAFTSDGTYIEHEFDPEKKRFVAKRKTYPRPYNNEFEIAHYTVDDTLNLDRTTYPSAFTLQVAKPFKTSAGQELLVTKVLDGRVIGHSTAEEPPGTDNLMAHLPVIRESTHVVDYVAGRGIAVGYVATNRWELEGDEKLTDTAVGTIFVHELAQIEEKPRWVIILFLIGVAVMGVIAVRYFVLKNRKNHL